MNDFKDFLENVTASDFDRSSKVDEARYPTDQTGPDKFAGFVVFQIEAARIAYAASDGWMNPWAILSNGSARRLFVPDDDETNEMYLLRLKREAQEFGARWFFIAMIAPVGIAVGDDEAPPSANDILENGVPENFRDGICWYAESAEPDNRAVRFGAIEINSEGRLGRSIENHDASHDGAAPMFSNVLRDVVLS